MNGKQLEPLGGIDQQARQPAGARVSSGAGQRFQWFAWPIDAFGRECDQFDDVKKVRSCNSGEASFAFALMRWHFHLCNAGTLGTPPVCSISRSRPMPSLGNLATHAYLDRLLSTPLQAWLPTTEQAAVQPRTKFSTSSSPVMVI
jgi:hypothetical protein